MSNACMLRSSLLAWRRDSRVSFTGDVKEVADSAILFADIRDMLSHRFFSGAGNDSLRFFTFRSDNERERWHFLDALI